MLDCPCPLTSWKLRNVKKCDRCLQLVHTLFHGIG
uniref:Uncharacterized protein n=1 Tax=Arundo donax TaxID=35708 RepID=A0A0A9BG38_ARUDO